MLPGRCAGVAAAAAEATRRAVGGGLRKSSHGPSHLWPLSDRLQMDCSVVLGIYDRRKHELVGERYTYAKRYDDEDAVVARSASVGWLASGLGSAARRAYRPNDAAVAPEQVTANWEAKKAEVMGSNKRRCALRRRDDETTKTSNRMVSRGPYCRAPR